MSTKTYKAYNARGELVLSTWAIGRGSQFAEEAAYQARLDRGELGWVDASSDDPREPNIKMRPSFSRR
jgi:hypothetical protein